MMSEEISLNKTVFLTIDFSACDVGLVRAEICKFLNNSQSVKEIKKSKTNGKVVPGTFELELVNAEDVELLVSRGALYLEHDDTLYQLKVCRSLQFEEPMLTSIYEEKSCEVPKVQKQSIPATTTWFKLLQTDGILFESYSDKSVLVQPESANISEKNFTDYIQKLLFESEISLKLGIKLIRHLNDGLLLAFEDYEKANTFLNEKKVAEEWKLQTFKKTVPPIYLDRFLLKNKFKQHPTLEVKQMIQSLTPIPFKVKKLVGCDMVLVIFTQDLPMTTFNFLLENMTNSAEAKPQILKVCRTDCIQVLGLNETVSDDEIRLKCMNKKYVDGEVTRIERDEENHNVAYIYFADYKDAENLVRNANQNEFHVQNLQLKMSLYWPGIYDSIDLSSFKLHQFHCDLYVDPDLVRFVSESRDSLADLCKILEGLADFKIEKNSNDQNFCIQINPIQTSQNEVEEIDQERFEFDCRTLIEKFFNQFKVHSANFPKNDVDRLRDLNRWQDERVYVEKKIAEDSLVKVFVCWTTEEERNMKVVGPPSDVDEFVRWFTKTCNLTSKSKQFDKEDFDVLINCGYVKDISSFFQDLKSDISKKDLTITFCGPKKEVSHAFLGLNIKLKQTQEDCNMEFLQVFQQNFLHNCLKLNKKKQIELLALFQDELIKSKIKVVVLHQKNSLVFKYDPSQTRDLKRAKEKIYELLKFRVFPVDGPFHEMVKEDQWKMIKSDVESNGKSIAFEDIQKSTITLVGLPSSFSCGVKTIDKYLERNKLITERVDLPFAKAEFFSLFDSDIGADEHLENVEWYQKTGGIHVKGRACLVHEAISWINEAAQTISTKSCDLCLPGVSTYLRSDSGKQFIQTTSKRSTCVITVDELEPPKWIEAQQKPKGYFMLFLWFTFSLLCKVGNIGKRILADLIKLAGNQMRKEMKQVKVTIALGNILNSKCEAMVNPIGTNFDLIYNLSKVSSVLLQTTGTSIINECDNNPIYKTDKLRVTSAPNTTFKNIVHLISPASSTAIADYLLAVFKIVDRELKLKSLAIPAIGTGKGGLNENDVAESISKAIDKFKKSYPRNLEEIEVVLFDDLLFNAFEEALISSKTKDSDKAFISILSNPVVNEEISTGSGNVSIKHGDILESKCEAIFNTVGPKYNLKASRVSAQVLQLAGILIQHECQLTSVLRNKCCKITSGGKSRYKNIVHFITPQNTNDLCEDLEDVLKFINRKLNVKSVAIPAIGTGNADLDAIDVAKAFGSAINSYFSTNPQNLTTIEVVIFDEALLSGFQTHIKAACSVERADEPDQLLESLPKPKPFSLKSDSNQKHKVVVYFTSTKKENIDKASKLVREKAKSKCVRRIVKHEVLEMLTDEDIDELKAIEEQFDVVLKPPEDDNAKDRFVILGLKDSVTKAYEHAHALLQQYDKAATCADYVTWMYMDPQANRWRKHPLLISYLLETSFKEDKSKLLNFTMQINGERSCFTADFDNLTQTSKTNRTCYKLKRFDLTGNCNYPQAWDGNKSQKLVTLICNEPEYNGVLRKFKETLRDITVVKLERVENKRLFNQFQAQRREVEDRMKKNNNVNQPVSRQLFHGTSHSYCEKICKEGFNRSESIQEYNENQEYGKGVCFLRISVDSDGDAVPNSDGEKRMFLADVITGEFTQGKPSMIDAPPRPGGTSADLFDCVVDNPKYANVFVVFNDFSAYPLYLLTYIDDL